MISVLISTLPISLPIYLCLVFSHYISHLYISPSLHYYTALYLPEKGCTSSHSESQISPEARTVDRKWYSSFPAAKVNTDRKKTGNPYDPHFRPAIHGGNFDPNYYNHPGGQLNAANPSDTRAPRPSHGGGFDPNGFDTIRFPERNQGQQPSSPVMASNTVQGTSDGRNGSERSNQTYSSNPTRQFIAVGFSVAALQTKNSPCMADQR